MVCGGGLLVAPEALSPKPQRPNTQTTPIQSTDTGVLHRSTGHAKKPQSKTFNHNPQTPKPQIPDTGTLNPEASKPSSRQVCEDGESALARDAGEALAQRRHARYYRPCFGS